MGGILKRLVFEGDTASSELDGPPSPIVKQKIEAIRRKGPTLSESDRAQLAELAGRAGRPRAVHRPVEPRREDAPPSPSTGRPSSSKPGKWTPWIDLTFKVNFIVRLQGMVQMLLVNAGSELQLYVSPVNFKPDDPPAADFLAGGLRGASAREDRQLPDARLGRSDLGAERGAHGREDVHGRPDGRVRRSREGDPAPARRQGLGSADWRHRVHRSGAAHDVAPDRSEAPALRCRARGAVRRLDRARLQARRRLRRRGREARRPERAGA